MSAGQNTDREYFFAEEGCWIAEWWNNSEDEAVSIAHARVGPGVTTAWHSLNGVTERYVILDGTGRAELGHAHREVHPGDVIVVPPDTPQRIINLGAGDLNFLVICTPRFRPEIYKALE